MFFNHLLYFTIFIILFSKNVVLSVGDKKSVKFVEEPEVKSFRQNDPPSKINNPSLTIHWGGEKVKIYDPEEPPITINKVRSDLCDYHKRKYLFEDPIIAGLERYIEKLSINGQIWHYVWKHCVVYSSLSSNRFTLLKYNYYTEMNLYRRLHGSKALKLDNYLSDQAQEAAKTYIKNGKSSFRRKTPLLVNMWYKESRSYNYRRPGPQLQTSHFTNLIWRSTVKVGIGIVKNDSYLYICFIYSPSGNVQRKYIDNVRKARYHLVNSRSFFSTLHNNN